MLSNKLLIYDSQLNFSVGDKSPVLTVLSSPLKYKVRKGKILKSQFFIQNSGKSNLVIRSISSTCMCTVVNYPKKEIKPNQKETIEVLFDSRDKHIGDHIQPLIFISNVANTYNKVLLYITVDN